MSTLRTSQIDVLVQGKWHRVAAALDETAITLGLLDADDGYDANPPMLLETEKRLVRVVKQEGTGLGISIQGGADNSRPIVIRYYLLSGCNSEFSKIFPGMAAALTNQLYVGDVILAVNGESLVNAKHDEAVRALKRSGQVVELQGNKCTIFMRRMYI